MAAVLDRAAFYSAVRLAPFPGHLTPAQVSGMDAILDACPPDTPTDHLAYGLGTCPVETAWTMLPIREKGGADYLTRMPDTRDFVEFLRRYLSDDAGLIDLRRYPPHA